LFGISLIYGTTGSLGFAEISQSIQAGNMLQSLAFILLFTGFAFKLSVVPFHLWTADVYEGSPVAVTAFLSVVSKGAMAFIFITVLYKVFAGMVLTWYYMLAFAAIISMVVGNLFALRQTNLKRFMAFSSIAQVGYLLIGISGGTQMGIASVVYFILIYVFSNLAAFGVISLISSLTGKETINDYKGLYSSNPVLAIVMALALFSLAGIPPTAGFFGKLFLLTAGAWPGNWALIIAASLNLIVSLYYYLRIIRAMFIDTTDEPLMELNFSWSETAAFTLCVMGILGIGFLKGLFELIYNLSGNF
ncbi:MAG TPA: NADH-quinone oxidoreductase subunit N, partial [Chitinophagales bacterium]|nr:NADH-quinone oxidoreductase subunit N [Chitinophagales bacterium]